MLLSALRVYLFLNSVVDVVGIFAVAMELDIVPGGGGFTVSDLLVPACRRDAQVLASVLLLLFASQRLSGAAYPAYSLPSASVSYAAEALVLLPRVLSQVHDEHRAIRLGVMVASCFACLVTLATACCCDLREPGGAPLEGREGTGDKEGKED